MKLPKLPLVVKVLIAILLGSFLAVVAVIFVMTLVILLLQYCVAGLVAKRNPFKMLAGMLPAYMTALGTASSA